MLKSILLKSIEKGKTMEKLKTDIHEPIQIVVVRADLPIYYNHDSIFKASIEPIMQKMRNNIPRDIMDKDSLKNEEYRLFLDLKPGSPLKEWIEGGLYKRSFIYVSSEKELQDLHDKFLKNKNINVVTSIILNENNEAVCFGTEPVTLKQLVNFFPDILSTLTKGV